MADAKFLTYNNVVIRRSDLQSLEGSNYLNDTIIDFYFSFLSNWYQSDEILLIPTSISFLLGNTRDWEMFKATIDSLDFVRKKLILFTVNDNSNFSSPGGGSHWSLLVYCRNRNMFMHYDSVKMMNYASACSIYDSVNNCVCYGTAAFVECCTPRQRNGYDCGLYVMEIAKVICECYFNFDRFRRGDEIWGSFDVMRRVDCHYVESDMRSDLLRIISRLKEEETNSS